MIQTYRRAIWTAIATTAALGLPPTLAQAVEVTASNGWSASFDGNISAHLIAANASTLGGAPSDVKDTRVTSGWNPSKFNAHVKAPEFNGITVTGNFQYATNITGANNDGFGSTNGNRNLDVDVRVLEADISGAFGTKRSAGVGEFSTVKRSSMTSAAVSARESCAARPTIGTVEPAGASGRVITGRRSTRRSSTTRRTWVASRVALVCLIPPMLGLNSM
jgi:hypothetical protein